LLTLQQGWFALIRETDSLAELMDRLNITVTGYWEDHYVLDQPSVTRARRLGEMMKKSILINAFVPLLYAYGSLRGVPACRSKALRWLDETGPERNAVVEGWRRLGVTPSTAAMSQSLLELKKSYCDPRRCLDCAVGQRLLGQTPNSSVPAIARPAPGSS
jgi:hypothetical protein